jgi:hypothetical protein
VFCKADAILPGIGLRTVTACNGDRLRRTAKGHAFTVSEDYCTKKDTLFRHTGMAMEEVGNNSTLQVYVP